jgi:hypothetical protein
MRVGVAYKSVVLDDARSDKRGAERGVRIGFLEWEMPRTSLSTLHLLPTAIPS